MRPSTDRTTAPLLAPFRHSWQPVNKNSKHWRLEKRQINHFNTVLFQAHSDQGSNTWYGHHGNLCWQGSGIIRTLQRSTDRIIPTMGVDQALMAPVLLKKSKVKQEKVSCDICRV
jgi:hypothetical protein